MVDAIKEVIGGDKEIMGIVTHGIPKQKVLDRFGHYNVLVETGTHVGQTALWASEWFKTVYTIESVEYYYNVAVNKLTT